MTHPIPLKAVLGTEVTTFHALLQTCWALQGPSILVAIGPGTLFLRVRHCRGDFKVELRRIAMGRLFVSVSW